MIRRFLPVLHVLHVLHVFTLIHNDPSLISGIRSNYRGLFVSRARGASDVERASDASRRPRDADERNRAGFLGGNRQGG